MNEMRISLTSCLILAGLLGSILGLWVRGAAWNPRFALCDTAQSQSVGVLSSDGKLSSILCQDSEIKVFETDTGKLISCLKDPFPFTNSGRRNPPKELRDPIRFEEGIYQMYFSNDNKVLRVDFLDGGYGEWASYTGEPLGGQMNGVFEELKPILVVGNTMIFLRDGKACLYMRSRPEQWWGIAWLPEFWLAGVSGLAMVWSLQRDWKILRRKKAETKAAAAGLEPAAAKETPPAE